MNMLTRLFNMSPSAQDIRVQLKEIERDQKRKRRDLQTAEQDKSEKIKDAIAAKKNGRQELLRDLFREMRQMEINNGHINGDLRRLSLAKTALSSFLRKMEMLERKKDRKSLHNLIMRFNEGSIQRAIDCAAVDDDTFNDMVEGILGDEELAVTQGRVKEDAGFADFDKAIGEMVKVEESGTEEEALTRLQEEVDRAIKVERVCE